MGLARVGLVKVMQTNLAAKKRFCSAKLEPNVKNLGDMIFFGLNIYIVLRIFTGVAAEAAPWPTVFVSSPGKSMVYWSGLACERENETQTGGKKVKVKKPRMVRENEVTENEVPSNAEENPFSDQLDNDEAEVKSPSSKGADIPEKSSLAAEKLETVDFSHPNDDATGKSAYGLVKVKIKTSKALDSQHTYSDAHTQSDTDKSSPRVELENQGAAREKVEDSANSLRRSNVGIFVYTSNKSSGIKLKSSKGFILSSMSACSNVEMPNGEMTQQKDPELPKLDRQHDKQQLDASLEVIKKVMKMDAAEPFNIPVDPIALGVPDYFDVIDTPMDFGTICCNLESSTKYMNSEDVYRGVQYIWDNCSKYNNKGDYILELMKRVKKSFMKYWTAAGLYTDHADGTNSNDTVQAKDVPPPTDGMVPDKNGLLTPTAKKHHGLKKHKDGCLCAICVMMRRRQEREENARMLDEQFDASEDYVDEDIKAQESSPMGSPEEYNSKNRDTTTQENADAQEEKPGDEKQNEATDDGREGVIFEQSRLDNTQNQHSNLESGDEMSPKPHEETPRRGAEAVALEQRKSKELLDNGKSHALRAMRYLV